MTPIKQGLENLTEEQRKTLNWAVKTMSVFGLQKNIALLSRQEWLKELSVFSYRMVDAILKFATHEEVDEIILKSAEKIEEIAHSFDVKDLRKLHWAENKERVVQYIRDQYTAVFVKVDYDLEQQNIFSQFSEGLKGRGERIEGAVSALLSTEEEANQKKAEINNLLDEFKQSVEDSPMEEAYKVIIREETEKVREKSLLFVDVKLKEEPVKLLFYRTGNRVAVKLKWNNSGYTYAIGRKREIRLNQGTDCGEYPMIVSVSYIDDFLYQNKVRNEDILVAPESVDFFYAFDSKISVNLTPSFVNTWWNYDCPDLYKKTPNKNRFTNMLGMTINHFSNKLVESSWTADYIDEDITEDEVRLLTKGREHTRMYASMRNVLQARKLKEDKERVDELKTKVHNFDAHVQSVIDKNRFEILAFLAEKFKERVVLEKVVGIDDELTPDMLDGMRINDNFGLDCGFLNIMTTDKSYGENRGILRNLDSNEFPWMRLKLPYESQSLTLMRKEFEKVKEVVLRETGIELYATTVLD